MSLALASPASAARRLPAPTPAQHRAAEARCSKLHPTVKAKCVDHLVLEKSLRLSFCSLAHAAPVTCQSLSLQTPLALSCVSLGPAWCLLRLAAAAEWLLSNLRRSLQICLRGSRTTNVPHPNGHGPRHPIMACMWRPSARRPPGPRAAPAPRPKPAFAKPSGKRAKG